MNNKVEFYQDEAGQWRWRFIAAENGEVLAVSSEGYANYKDADHAMKRVTTSRQTKSPFGIEVVRL